LKADVVREQLVRLARLDPADPLVRDLVVEPVPGDRDGLRWRTRVQYAATDDGRRAMRRHRSRDVVPVEDCLIAHPDARELPSTTPGAPIAESVVAAGVEHSFVLDADGFWQVHPGAPKVLVETVLEQLRPQPGESCLDLYAGVGLFSVFLAEAVGPTGTVRAVEGDREACVHAQSNLSAYPAASVHRGSVDRALAASAPDLVDVVVLDPPREGARRPVVEQVLARSPRAVAYVACDPAALARDVGLFAEGGYGLEALRAFDLFPMTHHVECVALLEKTGSDLR
jgi:tRNA/tmRNA/rRNA uracil-C5-methylase (TrmA/RlmC/RlmD family)